MRNNGKLHNLLIIVFLSLLSFGFKQSENSWERGIVAGKGQSISAIAIDQRNANKIFIASKSGVYESPDQGQTYQLIFTPKSNQKVNKIYISANRPRFVYLATDLGLYERSLDGGSFMRVYSSVNEAANQCLSLYRKENATYLGTAAGLFVRRDRQNDWKRFDGFTANVPITDMAGWKQGIVLSAGAKVYFLDPMNHQIRELLDLGVSLSGDEEDYPAIADKGIIRSLGVWEDEAGGLVVSSVKGIYVSDSKGQNWQKINEAGLPVSGLNGLIVLNHQGKSVCEGGLGQCVSLLAATDKGAFCYEQGRWARLYHGMDVDAVKALSVDGHGNIYAATESGVFTLDVDRKDDFNVKGVNLTAQKLAREEFSPSFNDEPTINQVHRWAVDYAEVSNDKIKSWRRLAKRKAMLPDLSIGLDRDAGDLFHWNTGANPDELQKGKVTTNWDISLSWDLADLIWSDEQTSIDSRSKLMVELREDILNQVTRLYFERRRLQFEMINGDGSDGLDIEKKLRIDELTALIDAMTGGEFSRGNRNRGQTPKESVPY